MSNIMTTYNCVTFKPLQGGVDLHTLMGGFLEVTAVAFI